MIKKFYELENTVMRRSLKDFIFVNQLKAVMDSTGDRIIDYFNEVLFGSTLRFELIFYWSVYHFEDRIVNIAEFQRFVKMMSEKHYNLNLTQTFIEDYLGVK